MRIPALLATAFTLESLLAAATPVLPRYDVAATLDTAQQSLSANVTITLAASEVQPVNEFLLGATYKITSLHAGPHATITAVPTDKPFPGLQKITVRCATPRRGELRLQLRYSGVLTALVAPPLNALTPDRIELSLDSFWLPAPDGFKNFAVKADIAGVPPDLVVVTSGSVRRANGHVYITREAGDVDLALVAARGLQRAESAGFELYAADLSTRSAQIYLKRGGSVLRFLEEWFGPMPGRPARVVMVERQRKSGYSRVGYIVITAGATEREEQLAHFMAHEFAHAWWSPCDPRSEDRWLSESIAEYVALRYVEFTQGPVALDQQLVVKRFESAKAGPLIGAGERGDLELYSKGPVLLFALEEQIGRTRMNGLLAGLAQHPPHTTAEFMDALRAAAGEESAREFDQAMRH